MAKKTCGCGMSGLSGTARRKLVKDVEVDGDTVVFTTAAWWRDCDPFVGVVGLNEKKVLAAIRREMRDAAKSARADEFSVDKEDRRYHSVADAEDDIAWSGIHRSALRDAVGSRELEEAIQELRDGNLFDPG